MSLTYPRNDCGNEKPVGTNSGIGLYAPEDIRKSYTDAVNKIKTDFAGLQSH